MVVVAGQSVSRLKQLKSPLRRAPVQERSAARVHRMLDACAEILDEVGYEGLTTTLLAERARVAIGSVYQFFPDKRAVVQALAQRNLHRYLARVNAVLAERRVTDWWSIVDTAIDEYVAMHRTTPGFWALHVGGVMARPSDFAEDPHTVFAGALGKVLVEYANVQPSPALDLALLVAVSMGDALIDLAFRKHTQGDEAVIAETKRVVRDYLTPVLGS